MFVVDLRLWQGGAAHDLWHEAVAAAQEAAANRRSSSTQAVSNIERAKRYAQEGAYGKAAKALMSDGIHDATDAVQSALIQKHPQVRVAANPMFEEPAVGVFPDPPAHCTFTVKEVRNALDHFPPASAAGGTALSPTHLQELIRTDGEDDLVSLGGALARFCDRIALGKIPTAVTAWFAGAPLTPLRKRSGGVRPIAVGESLRRLAAKMLMQRVGDQAATLLRPTQLGVSVRGGVEALVHTVAHAVREHGEDGRIGLLSLDFENAFNLINRQALIRAVHQHFPEILGYVRLCYANAEDPHLWCGAQRMRSVTGVQQGDPLGPLLFSLVLHDLLAQMPPMLAETADYDLPPAADNDPLPARRMFYIDDGYVLGPHAALKHAHDFFCSPLVRAYGLAIENDKTCIWWPTAPPEEVRMSYPDTLKQHYSPLTTVMQAPVGDDEQVAKHLAEWVQDCQPTFDALVEMADAHVAYRLLRECFSACRINFLLRVVPPR